ncbi:MAG: dipeptide epimerase [Firmicutes bacterium HGW-Firmicutes-21]|nr:MAG: dipeptide epimerase [Firmicutes bacterium HGW-Firmicutes-21]
MIIKDIYLYQQNIPLKTPFKTSLRSVDCLSSVIVELITDSGLYGYGAAAPTAAITGETMPSIICAVRDYIKPVLVGKTLDISLTAAITSAIAHNTSAKAAVETALYDLLSKEKGLPLFRYLGGTGDQRLKNDITISLNSPEEMAADAKKALDKGINILKIKLGGTAEEDVRRIDTVASVSRHCSLRLDANQAWSFENAEIIVAHCEEKGYNIEFIEQPFILHELELMKKLRGISKIPILADESVFYAREAEKIAAAGCADYINIKLAKCGGYSEAEKICDVAREAKIPCLMGCMLESPVGIIAAAHFAAANDIITMYDLDAVELLEYNPVMSSTEFSPDSILVKDTLPGLGITEIKDIKRID